MNQSRKRRKNDIEVPSPAAATPRGPATWLAVAIIAVAGIAAYSNSFRVPFLYDDIPSIPDNPTIHSLFSSAVLSPPTADGATVGGRPLLNLTLALNYAISGTNVWSYHALNLAIHLLAALTLFGIVRRTLLRTPLAADSRSLAFAVALIWTLHPLQTEAVTYVIQRAESLMGLFYLLTLYCFTRSIPDELTISPQLSVHGHRSTALSPRSTSQWAAGSVLCCALGMASKENMVSAPIVVLLYDRAFLAGSFAEALRRRRVYYGALALTWLPLAYFVYTTGGNRGGSIGTGLALDWWEHLLTETRTLCRYFALSLFPRPLVFDYGAEHIGGFAASLPFLVVAAGLVVVTGAALWLIPWAGLVAFWFLAVLAPNFIIPGPIQMTAEHRMYLPVAAVIVAVVLTFHRLTRGRGALVGYGLAAACGILTWQRNDDYRTTESIWADTADKRPDNAQAHNNLGAEYAKQSKFEDATREFEIALHLSPRLSVANINFANILLDQKQYEKALEFYLRSSTDDRRAYKVLNNIGVCLFNLGRQPEALARFQQALQMAPNEPSIVENIGDALQAAGQLDQAKAYYDRAAAMRGKPPAP